jgi:hypothetical protein
MLPIPKQRHDWPDAPLPEPVALCSACDTMEICCDGRLPDGWVAGPTYGPARAFCPDCAGQNDTGLFIPSQFDEGAPLAAVVQIGAHWYGLTHASSGRILAHQFGGFGFWRVKGAGQ